MNTAIGPDGNTFTLSDFSFLTSGNEVTHLHVDNQQIKIDADTSHLIHIQKTINNATNYALFEDANGADKFKVDGSGHVTQKRLTVEADDNHKHLVVKNTNGVEKFSVHNDGTTTTTTLNTTDISISGSFNHAATTDQISQNATDIQTNAGEINANSNTNIAQWTPINTHETQLSGATHLNTALTLVKRAQRVYFQELEAVQIHCDDIQSDEYISTLADGQFLWKPYITSGGSLAEEVGAKFRFGRSTETGQEVSPQDGLFMKRTLAGVVHTTLVSVHPAVANIHIVSAKDQSQPYILCSAGLNDPRFAVTSAGQIITHGQLSSNFAILPDSFHGSGIFSSNSVFIGAGRISFDATNAKLLYHVLKPNHVPTILQAAPYSLNPTFPASGIFTVHEWMQFARPLSGADHSGHALKTDAVFTVANLAADWDTLNYATFAEYTSLVDVVAGNVVDVGAVSTRVTTLEAIPQESYLGVTAGSVTFTGNGNNQWLTSPSQGTRKSGSITVNFSATSSVSAGTWLSVFIRFDENVLLDALCSFDITFINEDFSSIGSMSDLDVLFNARKSNFCSSSWTDSTDTTYTDEDFLHIRFESTRTQNSNTPFKIAYRVIPTSHRLHY